MGLSRRKVTREFKMSVVKKLEQGASLGVLSRALEVNPSVLHRWRVEGDPVAALERKIGQ